MKYFIDALTLFAITDKLIKFLLCVSSIDNTLFIYQQFICSFHKEPYPKSGQTAFSYYAIYLYI